MPQHAIAIPLTPGPLDAPDPARLVVAGFCASYHNADTHQGVTQDVKHFLGWLLAVDLPLLMVQRPHLELYLHHLQAFVSRKTGRPYRPATIARMFGTVMLLYAYAHEEGFIDRNPAARVQRPKVPEDEIGRPFLTPLEFAALLREAQANIVDHALVVMLGMMGLRISEATGLDIDRSFTIIDGYECISFVGKGSKAATVPIPAAGLRAIHAAIGQRTEGPLFTTRSGARMDRSSAARTLHRLAVAAHIEGNVTPHSLRRTFCTAGLLSGVALRDMQVAMRHADPSQTVRYDRMANGFDRHASHRVAGFLAAMAK